MKSTSRRRVHFSTIHSPNKSQRHEVCTFQHPHYMSWWDMCNTSFTIWHHWESQHIPEAQRETPSSDVWLSPQQVKTRRQSLDCDGEMVFSLTDAVAQTLTSGHRSQGRQPPAGACSSQDQETCRHQRAGRPLPTHPCCFRGCGLSGRPETWLQQLWRKQQSIDGANRAGGCIQTGPRTFSPHPRYERHSGTC